MSTGRWAVRHPGIGVLHYDTEQEAEIAAGTAGELLGQSPMAGEQITWVRGPANFPGQIAPREPEVCTTQSHRLQHLSTSLIPDRRVPGRSGLTVCGYPGQDERRANYWLERWGSPPIVVADLPRCRRCYPPLRVVPDAS
jgi:hypothetical protein